MQGNGGCCGPNCYQQDHKIDEPIKVSQPGGLFTGRTTFKAVLVGSSNVGKTTLQHRIGGTPIDCVTSTIGAAFYQVTLRGAIYENEALKMNLWDTGGIEKFNEFNLSALYFRGADFIFLVFDLFDRKSFIDLPLWLENANRVDSARRIPPYTILIGNKTDLETKKRERLVTLDEAQTFALTRGLQYIETSAIRNENCEEIKELVMQHINKTIKKEKEKKENRAMEKEKEKEKEIEGSSSLDGQKKNK
ncbi:hypothetical protein DFA_06170 [Cavenderia fasciculata]|uniref:Rab GTPase n=1 Tax=Cavenderia fasciculata TaxID=261658 RepID=F4PKA8_CACFS|nr:uncharacterized protein DFA_06170 [Cavenderia fasciculata]EGG24032.1 hypothetical protein DFA_06170 [Cavenderia fasciculata]|eukprot:XP_004361883.1 hypothetical protein DFA_06170 [Cavenderia fasciculata]